MKTWGIVAASALVLSGLAIGVPAQADDDWRHHVACDHRVCLIVLEDEDDSDGDGIADVDEKYLGSDFLDRLSMPAAQKLIDSALMRELPSFESHITELVALPQMTTDFSKLATAVGLTDLPTDSWGTNNIPHLLPALQANGLTGILSAWGITLPGSGHELPEGSDAAYFTYMQQVMDKTDSTTFTFPNVTSGGPNDQKVVTSSTIGGISVNYEGGVINMHAGQSTYYVGGSHDGTSYDGTKNPKTGAVTTNSTTIHQDDNGNTIGKTVTKTTVEKNKATGGTTTTTTTTRTGLDNGKVTGSTTTTTVVTTNPKAGTKETKTSGSTTDANGKTTPDPETKPVTEKCKTKDCKDGMSDPDYVTFGPLTKDDYRKVMARLNSIRTPGPDTGLLTDSAPQIPTRDIYSNYTGDGVVVLSSEPNPRFNIAQPEYNGELAEMAQLGGTVPPNPNADDPTGYWPDKP